MYNIKAMCSFASVFTLFKVHILRVAAAVNRLSGSRSTTLECVLYFVVVAFFVFMCAKYSCGFLCQLLLHRTQANLEHRANTIKWITNRNMFVESKCAICVCNAFSGAVVYTHKCVRYDGGFQPDFLLPTVTIHLAVNFPILTIRSVYSSRSLGWRLAFEKRDSIKYRVFAWMRFVVQ